MRGGVLDVFVPLYRFPVRIEFSAISSSRCVFTIRPLQRTLRKTDEIYIHPVRETILTRGHKLRERLLEVGDLAVHPSSRTRNILEQIESGTDFFGVESLIPAFHEKLSSIGEYLPEHSTFVVVEPHRLFDSLSELHRDGESVLSKAHRRSQAGVCTVGVLLDPTELRRLLLGSRAKPSLCVEIDPLVITGEDDAVPAVRLCGEDHRLLAAELQRGQRKSTNTSRSRWRRCCAKPRRRCAIGHRRGQSARRRAARIASARLRFEAELAPTGLSSLAVEKKSGEAVHHFDLLDSDPQLLGGSKSASGRCCVASICRSIGCRFIPNRKFLKKRFARSPKRPKPSLGDLKTSKSAATSCIHCTASDGIAA